MYLLILLTIINAIEFNQELPKREIACFGDSIIEGLTVFGIVTSETKEFSIKIYNPMRFKKEGYIHQSQNEQIQQFKFKTSYNHNIQMCIQNLSTQTIKFQLKYTKDDEEKSQQIDMQLPMNQLKPVENLLTQMKISYDVIKSMFSNATDRQESRLEQIKQLGLRITVLSITLLIAMAILTFIGTLKFKKLLNEKKSI